MGLCFIKNIEILHMKVGNFKSRNSYPGLYMGMSLHLDSDKYWSFFGYFETYKLRIEFSYIKSDIYIGLKHAAKKTKS
jgi:hypothetical protein